MPRSVLPMPVLALLALIGAASLGMAAVAQDAPADPPLPRVTVAPVEMAEVVARVAVSGTLVAREEVLVTPQVSGFPIEALVHDVGDRVAAGEVVARLDDRTLQAQLMQAEAELARARAAVRQARSQIDSARANADEAASALDRTRRLRDAGTTTQAVLDQSVAAELTARATLQAAQDGLAVAEAQVQQAQAARDIAALNARNAIIRAPVSGVIAERAGRVGAVAGGTGEPLYRIIRDGAVELEAEVIETELGAVAVGQAAELRVAGIGPVAGEVRRVSPTVDPVTRLGTVRISLVADGLRPGLFATGWIVTERRTAPTVPVASVLTDAGGDHVLALDGDTLVRRNVTAGLVSDDLREIVDGVAADDVVVARAGGFFAAGDRVDPVPAGQDAEAPQ